MPKMYGPAMDGSKTIVNRDVPDADVGAYQAAGYAPGNVPGAPTAEEYGASKSKPESETDISKMTKAELMEEANRLGVAIEPSATKAEIVEAIESKES